MRKSLDGHGLRRNEAYPQGDTARFDKSHARQDLASDQCGAILSFRFNQKKSKDRMGSVRWSSRRALDPSIPTLNVRRKVARREILESVV